MAEINDTDELAQLQKLDADELRDTAIVKKFLGVTMLAIATAILVVLLTA